MPTVGDPAASQSLANPPGNDVLRALGGNDLLAGGSDIGPLLGGLVVIDGVLLTDNDLLDGGGGIDTVSYASHPPATIELNGTIVEIRQTNAMQPFGVITIMAGRTVSVPAPPEIIGPPILTPIGPPILTPIGPPGELVLTPIAVPASTAAGAVPTRAALHIVAQDSVHIMHLPNYRDTPLAVSGVTVTLLLQGVPQDTIGAGIDTLIGIENLTGTNFGDHLTGDAGNNILIGLAGNDSFVGGAGDDLINGGEGTDTADYSAEPGPVRAFLGQSWAVNTISAGRDKLLGIENLKGSAFNDFLMGDAGANMIDGGAGNDFIVGGDGDDTLVGSDGNDAFVGGRGADTIDPGAGFDTLRYGAAADSQLAAMDVIAGYTARGEGKDRIGFENAAGALFAGVAPTTIAFSTIDVLQLVGTPEVQPLDATVSTPVPVSERLHGVLGSFALAASSATSLAVTRVDIEVIGASWLSVVVVNDTDAAFDAATDMVIAFAERPGALSASNFFLF